MEASGSEPQIDARAVRFELWAVAVVLLAGFVFHQIWIVPVLAAVLAVGVGIGRQVNLFHQLFDALVAGRLKPATAWEPAGATRFSEFFAVVLLSIATLLFAIAPNFLGWIVVLIEAGVCALHASTGISVERAAREKLFPDGKRNR